MSDKTNALEDIILNRYLRGIAGVGPFTAAVGLFTALPNGDGESATVGGVAQNEVANAGSYARTLCGFGAPSSNQVVNAADITFPTASAAWGTVTHFAIHSTTTYGAGSILYFGTLPDPKVVGNGDIFEFLASQLVISEA